MKDRLRITSGGVKAPYSEIEYTTSWRKTFENKNSNQYKPTIIEYGKDKTKKIIDYFITNIDNDKIEDYKENDIIFLNIKTKNRKGDYLTLDLNDADYDFEYNGKILPNDILKDIKVTNDNLTKVKLKVIKPKNKKNEKN